MLYLNKMPDDWCESVSKRIGKNIRKKRLEAGWSINRMYAETGIDRITIQRWETATRPLNMVKVLWLCKCTGWKLSELMGGGTNA